MAVQDSHLTPGVPMDASGELPKRSGAAPSPVSRAFHFTRYIVLLAVVSVLLISATIFLVGPALALWQLWMVLQDGVRGDLGHHEGLLTLLGLVIVMLEAVVFYLIGIGLYHLFIDSLPLADQLGVDSLDKLESKLVSVIVVKIAVIFLERLVLGHSAYDALLYGGAIGLAVPALTWFKTKLH